MDYIRVFFKADLGVNFALRFFGVTPRFCSAAATAVLRYTTIRVGHGRCSVELHQGRAELHQGLNLKKNPGLYYLSLILTSSMLS